MILDTPTAEEFAFVFDSWARSFRRSPWAGCVPNNLWDAVSRECSKGIVDRGARVVVARPDDVARVMGYSVYEPDRRVLHFLYVKDSFRRMGVGTALLNEAAPDGDWTYSHRTRVSQKFLGSRFVWDPVSARTK